jgi:hypothetical protein
MVRRSLALFALTACAEPPPAAPPPVAPPPPPSHAAAPPPKPGPSLPPKPTGAPPPDTVFARVKSRFVRCYEDGAKKNPEMTAGKATFHVSVASDGATRCVVPSDDNGLTQEVEDCMRTTLEGERFTEGSAPWVASVPVVVRDGKVALGSPAARTPSTLEMIESHGLGDDLYDVVTALIPDLTACLGPGEGAAHVGAKVARDGTVTCAVATSAQPLSEPVRRCAEGVLGRARFKPPKPGYGLLSLPIAVQHRSS